MFGVSYYEWLFFHPSAVSFLSPGQREWAVSLCPVRKMTEKILSDNEVQEDSGLLYDPDVCGQKKLNTEMSLTPAVTSALATQEKYRFRVFS